MRAVWPGRPNPRGATFDGQRRQLRRLLARRHPRRGLPLRPRRSDARDRPLRSARDAPAHVWHGYVPGSAARARSTACACTAPTRPSAGTAATRASCSSIPTPRRSGARSTGSSRCSATSPGDRATPTCSIDQRDSAAGVPKGGGRRRRVRLGRRPAARDALARDDHLRGRTCAASPSCTPRCPEALRGTYAGLAHPAAIEHLTTLGVTAVELLPVHEFADDGFLEDRVAAQLLGLQHARLLRARAALRERRARPGAQVAEFKAMVKALHAAGHRGDPGRRLQPHLRGEPPGPDAEPARDRQRHLLLADAGARATTSTSPAPATASTRRTPRRRV